MDPPTCIFLVAICPSFFSLFLFPIFLSFLASYPISRLSHTFFSYASLSFSVSQCRGLLLRSIFSFPPNAISVKKNNGVLSIKLFLTLKSTFKYNKFAHCVTKLVETGQVCYLAWCPSPLAVYPALCGAAPAGGDPIL